MEISRVSTIGFDILRKHESILRQQEREAMEATYKAEGDPEQGAGRSDEEAAATFSAVRIITK